MCSGEGALAADGMETILSAVITGIGATVLVDLWAILLTRLFDVPATNWAMVGRWVATCHRDAFITKTSAKPRRSQQSSQSAGRPLCDRRRLRHAARWPLGRRMAAT